MQISMQARVVEQYKHSYHVSDLTSSFSANGTTAIVYLFFVDCASPSLITPLPPPPPTKSLESSTKHPITESLCAHILAAAATVVDDGVDEKHVTHAVHLMSLQALHCITTDTDT